MERLLKINNQGQLLVELLIAIGLTAILIPALLTGFVASREGKVGQTNRLKAGLILKEAVEAVRSIREKNWSTFAIDGVYHPEISGFSWVLATGAENIDGFTRQVVINSVNRDATGAIVNSPGTLDPSTKKIEASVSWSAPVPSNLTNTFYLTRFVNNSAFVQTTRGDFDTGTKQTTEAFITSDGELRLESWSTPTKLDVDIGGSENATGVAARGNYGYVVTEKRGGERAEFYIYDLNNNNVVSSLEFNEDLKAINLSGNFVYILSVKNNAQLRVVDITNPTNPSLVATYDTGVNKDGLSLSLSSNYAYLGAKKNNDAEFWIIDVSNPLAPNLVGKKEIDFNVNSISLSDNYAYLATTDPSGQLKVIDITNKASPTNPVNYDVGNNRSGLSVFYLSNTVFLGIEGGAGADFYTIDVSNSNSPSALGSVDIGDDVNSVSVLNGIAYLATSKENKEFTVVSTHNLAALAIFATLDLGGKGNNLYFQGTKVYAATGKDNAELQIINGGGESNFNDLGIYESSSFDASSNVAFNSLNFKASVPSGTELKFQIAINTDGTSWNYFGPDGSSNTYYTSSGPIPLNKINGRYLRYKATLTGPGTTSPVLNEVGVNYSL